MFICPNWNWNNWNAAQLTSSSTRLMLMVTVTTVTVTANLSFFEENHDFLFRFRNSCYICAQDDGMRTLPCHHINN